MRSRVFVVLVIALLASVAAPARGQSGDVSVVATAEPMEVGTSDRVTVTIQVRGAPLEEVETPEPPATANLVLRQSTPTTRRDLTFKDGRLDRSVQYQWTYEPRRAGIARVRPLQVVVRGETYTTEEIRIRVVPQGQSPSSSSSRMHAGTPKPNPPRFEREGRRSTISEQDLFIRAEPSQQSAFRNEQLTVAYRLFFRPGIQLRHSRLADAWDANGFWREELKVASRPVPQVERVGGDTYRSIVLKRVAIFPTRSGTLDVEPLRIQTEANSSDPRSGEYSMNGRFEPVSLASEPLRIDVAELPGGAPRAFNGAVGSFSLRTTVDADSVRVGEAVRMTVRVSGTGNFATLQPPTLDIPSAFDTYDPTVETDVDRGGSVLRGTKTFTYVLVPQSNGTYRIPPVAFAYFNPETEEYETVQGQATKLKVFGDAAPVATSTTGRGLPVGDITGVMTGAGQRWVRPDAPPLYRQPWTYAALALPLLIAGGVFAARRRRPDEVDDVSPTRRDTALNTAQDHLQKAERHLRNSDVKPFYRDVERAVLEFIAARLDRTVPGLTRAVLNDALTRYGADPADREALRELLDACDQAQFTPSHPSFDSMQAALNHAHEIILHLDDVLPEE